MVHETRRRPNIKEGPESGPRIATKKRTRQLSVDTCLVTLSGPVFGPCFGPVFLFQLSTPACVFAICSSHVERHVEPTLRASVW